MRYFLFLLTFLVLMGELSCRTNLSPTVSPTTYSLPVKTTFISPIVNPLPNIKELVLFIARWKGHSSIYAVSPDGVLLFRILEFPEPFQITGHLDWSSKRKQLAFAMTDGERSDIFVIDLMTGMLKNVTAGTPFGGIEPRWSPDGTRLAYVCGEYEPDICIIGADGHNYIQLTSHPSWDINPSWSLDGSAIAYQSNRGGLADIYIINLRGGWERNLTQRISQNAQPSWSLDGKMILFQSDRDGSMDIFTISSDGARIINLTRNTALDVDPRWSPNGEFIAFRSNRDGEWNLFIMRRDGSGLTNLTAGWGPVFTYAWSPDSRYLVFASGRGGSSDIYRVDINNGNIIQLTHDSSENMGPLWISLED